MNIGAKLFATLWYLLIMPDSTSRLKRQVRTKRLPWYSPARILGIAVAAANVVSVPASWVLLIAGRRNASRVASLGVLANPPTLQISVILVQEIVKQVMGSSCSLVVSCGTLLSKPVKMLMSVGRGGSADEQGEDETPSAGDDSATGSTPPPPPPPTTTTTTTTGSDKPATTDTTPTKPAATTGTPTPVGSTPKTDAASTTSAPGPKP